ncbi:MAG: twin-arginine translocase TatA/TatE family subunit [Candidatus Thermoplasmatota archaeon]|jgi:TatA/E family protein of Tat protein translocase|nr:twin-arginine translocase TatA/TatE family subunit [Candidatus Thermoplasmatota archaeon]
MGLLGLGSTEIILILVFFAMLFLGGKKIPEFARGLGRAMGEFKRGRLEIEREIQVSGMDKPIPREQVSSETEPKTPLK